MYNFSYLHAYFLLTVMKTPTCFDPQGIIDREYVHQMI